MLDRDKILLRLAESISAISSLFIQTDLWKYIDNSEERELIDIVDDMRDIIDELGGGE